MDGRQIMCAQSYDVYTCCISCLVTFYYVMIASAIYRMLRCITCTAEKLVLDENVYIIQKYIFKMSLNLFDLLLLLLLNRHHKV